MSKNQLLLFSILCFTTFGCAQQSFVKPEYQNIVYKNAVLMVASPKSYSTKIKLEEIEKLDLEDIYELEENLDNSDSLSSKELYILFLQNHLEGALLEKSTFMNVFIQDLDTDIQFKERKLLLPQRKTPNKLTFKIPQNKIYDADFVLFLNKIRLYKSEQSGVNGSWPVLVHEVEYMIWDNRNLKIVAYGRKHTSVPQHVFNSNWWDESLPRLSGSILNDTPFEHYNKQKEVGIPKKVKVLNN